MQFSIDGIPVRVRISFWLLVGLIGISNGFEGGRLVAFAAAVFLAVLLHELGHAFTARWAGADPIRVELYFLGGVTMWSSSVPLPPLRRLAVAASGSAVGIAGGLLALIPLRTMDPSGLVEAFLLAFVFAGLVWGVLNWAPIRSLDGGVIVASFFEWAMPRRGTLVAEVVLLVFGVAAVIVAAAFGEIFIAAVVAYFGLGGIGSIAEAWREVQDDRRLGEVRERLESSFAAGDFVEAAEAAERLAVEADSQEWRNLGHAEAIRCWYLAGDLGRAVSAADAWPLAEELGDWVVVQAYMDAGRMTDVQRVAAARLVELPVMAGPLAVADIMAGNRLRLDRLLSEYGEELARYLPMKALDRIAPLDPFTRRRVAEIVPRLPGVDLLDGAAVFAAAGLYERALALVTPSSSADADAIEAWALAGLGRVEEAESALRRRPPSPAGQETALRLRMLDLAEELGEDLLARVSDGDRPQVLFNHARTAALREALDTARLRLAAAVDAGFSTLRSLNYDPDLAPIRDDRWFPELRSLAWSGGSRPEETAAPR